jgi:Transglycosylase SLT domain
MAQELIDKIRAAAQAMNLDPDMAVRIARAESSLSPTASVGTSTGKGLFGILDKTWQEFGGAPGKQMDPDENIRVGTRVIASNTNYLRKRLGREPSASEVYAAHFFGPSGASNFFAASPDTPMERVLSPRAIKANPVLQGKTAQEVRALLEKKVGAPVAAPAPAGVKPALRSGMTASADDLGQGYKAALALSFLGTDEADQPEGEDRLQARMDREAEDTAAAELAKYKSFNALNDLQLSATSHLKQPVRMADGGEAQSDEKKEERPVFADLPERRDIDFIRSASKQQVGDRDIQNLMLGLGVDEGVLGVNLSKMRQGEKDFLAHSLMAAYNTKFGDMGVNASVVRPLAAPAGVVVGNLGASYPVGPGQVMANTSMLRTPQGDVVPMTDVLGYSGKIGPGQLNATIMQPRGNAQGRQYQLQYAIPFADGGEATASRPTPQEIERMALEDQQMREAASQPVGIEFAQKSGRGRQQGPISQALNTGTAYPAMGRGVLDLPYSIVGAPVDLTTMALRPFGYGQEKPMMGSEWIKEKMTDLGVRPPSETDPTLAGFRTAGELGASLVSPAAVGRTVVGAGSKARDMLSKLNTRAAEEVERVPRPANPPVQAPAPAPVAATPAPPAPVQAPAPAPVVTPAAPMAAPVVAETVAQPTAQAAQMLEKLPAAPVAAPVSAEFPFAGRLDAFAQELKNPVQKEQLINQVKNKFRDYDVGRLEIALSSFGPKDKITPQQLQEALATTHAPSGWRSVDIKPGDVQAPYSLYDSMDNVYAPARMGTTNLFLNIPEEAQQASKSATGLYNAFTDIYKLIANPEMLGEVKKIVEQNPKLAGTEQGKKLTDTLDYVTKSYTSIKNAQKEINDINHGFFWPVLYKDKAGNEVYFRLLKEESVKVARELGFNVENQSMIYSHLRHEQVVPIEREAKERVEKLIMQEANKRLADLGGDKLELSKLQFISSGSTVRPELGRSTPGFDKLVENALEPVQLQINEASKRIRRTLDPVFDAAYDVVKNDALYRGQHATVTVNPYPIGFARFTEHEANIPGIGTVQGRHYHELQSDLVQDVKTYGSKTGSAEKDAKEYEALTQKHRKFMNDLANNPPTTEEAKKAAEIEYAKMDDRLLKLGTRRSRSKNPSIDVGGGVHISPYSLEEPFAGAEGSPAVMQQLLMKNAIQAAMRDNKNFVTFPGSASAQSHLYEGVLNNLRQVVKDMGGEKAGFQIQTRIELPPTTKEVTNKKTGLPTHPVGEPLNAVGVVWGPEAAKKITQSGVPFKDGGLVERVTDDNRRYL